MSLEDLHKDTSEADLWDLADESAERSESPPTEDAPESSPDARHPTEIDDIDEPDSAAPDKPTTIPGIKSDRASANRNKTGGGITSVTAKSRRAAEPRKPRSEPIAPPLTDFDDLDELDDWDTAPATPTTLATPATPADPKADTPDPQPPAAPYHSNDAEPSSEPPTAKTSKISVPSTPAASSLPVIRFSRTEVVGLLCLLGILTVAAGWFVVSTISGLPKPVNPHQQPKLPARGQLITITKADSHWRVPITTGQNADTVQRGTSLMPVLEITASGENTSLRIQFRNSEGIAVGDSITRAINGETQLTIPSTAGLEDINTHNAYRAGLIDPWTAEILEAPAGTTAGGQFQMVLTVPISPNRR